MANRLQLLICAFVLIASTSLATGTNDAVVLAQGQSLAWIRTSADKTHFVCDGTDNSFVPWGFNYDRDEAGRLLEDYWADDWAKVADDFREMKSLGANVVRIHLQLCRFMKSPEQPDEKNLARLGKLVRLAEATGLYLDVTGLGCYHKQDVPAWYDAMDESARWKVQAHFWRAVAGVCNQSPAIFCYDLMNEPIPSGDQKGDWLPGQPLDGSYFVQRVTTDMRGRTDREIAKEWTAELSAAIRSVDQRHMITVGLVPWEQTFGPGAKNAFRDPDVSAALDFLCIHYYPRDGKLDDDLAILKLYDTGKPLVIEEIFPLSADVETTAEFIRRSRTDANGWISFYWGKTPEEYGQEPGIQASVTGNWLRHFCALRGEMLGGTVSPKYQTQSPPPHTSAERRWLSRQKKWFGAAALLYAFYFGCAAISYAKSAKGDGHRLPFPLQIMREFFFTLPRNFAGCFKGWNIAWQLMAIGLGVVLVTSGFDWSYFSATRSPQLLAWMLPTTYLGIWVPLTLPPSLLLAGLVLKRAAVIRTGAALAQTALIGFALTELYKAVTGRPHPPSHMVFVGSQASHVFHFGILPGWDFSPYPVTEADNSHVFHFGILRSDIVSGWPSGHTGIAFGMAATLLVLFPQKRWLGVAALLYAFYIGMGVSMTIHWFADCASGAIFGTIIGTTVARSFAAMEFKDSQANEIQRSNVSLATIP